MRLLSDYLEALENPKGIFKTLKGEISLERDDYNEIKISSGADACVFKIFLEGKPLMLKCYVNELAFLCYKYDFLSKLSCPYLVNYRYLADEITVFDRLGRSNVREALVGDWLEGETLADVIEWAVKCKDKAKIGELAESFDAMAKYLLAQNWAHGDIKPENIIVLECDNSLKLIDLDSAFIPGLDAGDNIHLGTPPFVHPGRGVSDYDRHIDDYSLLVISVSLHGLSFDESLYLRFHKGDNIILNPEEIFDNSSEVYNILLGMWRENIKFTAKLKALRSPSYIIDNLKELF